MTHHIRATYLLNFIRRIVTRTHTGCCGHGIRLRLGYTAGLTVEVMLSVHDTEYW